MAASRLKCYTCSHHLVSRQLTTGSKWHSTFRFYDRVLYGYAILKVFYIPWDPNVDFSLAGIFIAQQIELLDTVVFKPHRSDNLRREY